MEPISLHGGQIDLAKEKLKLPSDASKTQYILIQCKSRLSLEQKTKLKAVKVIPQEYLDNGAYLCYYDDTSLRKLESLDFIEHTTVYDPEHKLDASLRASLNANGSASITTTKTVGILLHRKDATASKKIADEIAKMPAATVSSVSDQLITANVNITSLRSIATHDEVTWIDELPPLVPLTIPAREILKSVKTIMPSGTLSNTYGLTGKNQIVAIADSGFDFGSLDKVHPAFTGRIIEIQTPEGGPDNTPEDQCGHGTHVAGCVAADGDSPAMGKVQGVAPEAKLVIQSLWLTRGPGSKPCMAYNVDFPTLIKDAAQRGARIHNNSYGMDPSKSTAVNVAYTMNAMTADATARNYPGVLICCAAGNAGDAKLSTGDPPIVGDRASAKNCLIIGASQTTRKLDKTKEKYDPKGQPGNPIDVANFSTRGPPYQSERIKPDVVAPGVAILSTASRSTVFQNAKADSGGRSLDVYGKTQDNLYWFGTGTSMAAPLVAGCAAIIREGLQTLAPPNLREPDPPAILLKALIINGTEDLKRGTYRGKEIGPAPNGYQGHGLVNLEASLRSVVSGYFRLETLSEHNKRELVLPIANPYASSTLSSGSTFAVTLVYHDRQGQALQNVLELEVKQKHYDAMQKRPSEKEPTIYLSNKQDNVAKIVIPTIGLKEEVELTVRIPDQMALVTDDQDFALAWSWKLN